MAESRVYEVAVLGHVLEAKRVRGREALSTPTRLFVVVTVPPGVEIDPSALLRNHAAVGLLVDGVVGRRIDGIVTEATIEITRAPGVHDLSLVIESRLALGRFRSDSRVFRDRTVPEIVQEVLSALGFEPKLRLTQSYERRGYCVQMQETDLAFVSRLLEHEGIHYWLEAGDAIVLADDVHHADIDGDPVVPYLTAFGLRAEREAVIEIGERARLAPAKVTMRDFTVQQPRASLHAEAEVSPGLAARTADVEHYDFPGEHSTSAIGERRAKVRAESFAADAAKIRGLAHCLRLAPGLSFVLEGAPDGIDDGKLLVTAIDHDHSKAETATARLQLAFEALPASIPFRPLQETPEPILSNPLTGFVVGPGGQDIHTDSMGRVKVRFPWDRRSGFDDSASDWIPVLQDNTGHSVAIPRVGWEVVAHFLEGDPDRPVVLGRVYNGADPFPEALPKHKTRSALRSLSSPSRDGLNQIRFEDLAGNEQLFVHAERDENVVVANDKREDVVADEERMIVRDETITIGDTHRETVASTFQLGVAHDQTEAVGASRTVHVKAGQTLSVAGKRSVGIGSSHHRRVALDDVVQAKSLHEQVGAVIVELSIGPNTTDATLAQALTVGGAVVEAALGDKKESAGLARVETIGGIAMSTTMGTTSFTSKAARTTTVGGALIVHAAKTLTLTGKETLAAKALTLDLASTDELLLLVGETMITMADGVIGMSAKSKIEATATGANDLLAKKATEN